MKLDIVFAVPGMAFNGNTFDKQSLGGSESAAYYMARALAKLGHRVTVFCNTEPVRTADVDYLPIGMFRQYVEFTTHDVCIVQRTPELLPGVVKARLTILWCHDLALGRSGGIINGMAWNYDKLFVLSKFMRDQYQKVYSLPEEFVFTTRNGIDLETVQRVQEKLDGAEIKSVRNPVSLVFGARPERGLDILFGEIMPRILKQEPNAKLFLSTYQNPVNDLADFYAHCKALGERLGDRVEYLGHLTKDQLYEVYQRAGLYIYPVPSTIQPEFDEVSCISLMEAQACGLPVVTSARGALPETLAPGAGALISDPVHTPEYYDAFASAALRLMRSPEEWKKASAAGEERAKTLDWSRVAEEWSQLFEAEIRKNSADLATMANHFWRRSDIYAARECLRRLPVDDKKSAVVRERVQKDWAFLDEPDGFRAQYERIGGTHNPAVIDWAPREPRYAAMRDWLKQNANLRNVLDYGCAHGAYATNLLKEIPDLRITGVDIDQHGIELGYSFADKLGVTERWRGVVGGIDRLTDESVPEMTEQYDLIIAQEVMEHVADPSEFLRALEMRVKDGGYIYITVPYGPWEYTDYLQRWGGKQSPLAPEGMTGYPHRAHIWEFDQHDISDLLDLKGKDAQIVTRNMPFGHEPNTYEPLGWWVINYKVTPETRGKVGAINMERKLWLQRPRQTVSAIIMAGGSSVEETLHWCLRSLEHIADEVVIADCGLSAEAHRILSLYDSRVRIIPGVDPKTEGFETPRNMALQAATQDWVLWIDTDEKLLNADHLTKYLRRNTFQGYSIKQHHFACDTTFDADLPVRMFRNNGKLRFFGMIHEHPESDINAGPGRTIVIGDVHIPHIGYLLEPGRKVKFDRNLPMLEADIHKYPTRKLQKHFIMRDKMLLVQYRLQQNGGRMTPDLKQLCRDVQDLWRQHFRGTGHFTNVDPIIYYSQATSLLAEGFSTAFQFTADKIEARPNGAAVLRFANEEDVVAEISHRIRDTVAPFTQPYF